MSLTIRSDGPVSISCAGGAWAHAAINTTSWANNTDYTLSATLTDTAGNTGGSVTKSVNKDTSALAVDINTPDPINNANKGSYPVSGRCSSHVGTLTVTVGGQRPGTQPLCSSMTWATTVDVSLVPDNSVVPIRMSFISGISTVIANTTVLKDILPPTLTMTTPSAINLMNQRNYSVSGTCREADQPIQVVIGGLNFNTDCTGNKWSLENKDVSSLTEEVIIITANTTDTAGNAATQASGGVIRDIVPPVLTMSTSDFNINAANVATYILKGSCDGVRDVKITIGDLDKVSVICFNDRWALAEGIMQSLSDGQNIAVLIALDDGAGNSSTIRITLNKDVIAPGVSMTSSPLVSSSNVNSYPMAGTCDENGTGVLSVTIAGGTATSADCQGGNWQKNVDLSTQDEGNISVSITHQDAPGNETTITPTLKKDTIVPALTISSPVLMNSANQNAYTIRGTCNEDGTQITVSIGGQAPPLLFTCASLAWQVSGDFTSLADNSQIGITAFVQDGHGNRSTKTASFAKDATLPEVTINALEELTDANKAAFPLTGSCDENTRDVVVSAKATITPTTIVPAPQPTCGSDGWTTSLDLSTLRGDITIRAYQVDAAENRGDVRVIILAEGKTFLHSKIASGGFHSCVLSSGGGVKCWGAQSSGRLGNNSTEKINILYPVDVVGPDTDSNSSGGDGILGNIVQISAGSGHTCALNSSGNVLCWGWGIYGQLGNNATANSSFPVQVVGPDTDGDNNGNGVLGNIVQISTGEGYTCVLNSSGNVLCWGRNHHGQLGDDSTSNRSYPVFVVASNGSTSSLSGVVQLSGRYRHTCALTSVETVLCWGWGRLGQLGSSSETTHDSNANTDVGRNRDAPLVVLTQEGGSPLSGIAQVASGDYNTCALTLDGHVKCWGTSSSGALGDNGVVTDNQSWFPVDVVGEDTDGSAGGDDLLSDIVQITLGGRYACALKAQDKVLCWGNGSSGQLGDGRKFNKNYPVSVIAGSGSSSSLSGIVEITSYNETTCGLSEEGRVLCWGEGLHGQLGYGGIVTYQLSPVTAIPASGSTDFLNIGTYRGSYTCKGGVCALDPIGLSLEETSSSPSTGDSPSIEVSGIGTGKTLNLYSSVDCSTTSKGTASPSDTTIALSTLSEGAYKYYFDMTDSSSKRSGCSKSFISYIYDSTAPFVPALRFNSTSGTDTTPDISVSGITPGDLVQVYSDSGCTTVAAPATRVDGVARRITLNAISEVGTYNFYATATDAAANVSACSSAATYTLNGL